MNQVKVNYDESALQFVLGTVPQVYRAKAGPCVLTSAANSLSACSLVPLSEKLKAYLQGCEETYERIRRIAHEDLVEAVGRDWIEQKFIERWLKDQTGIGTWSQIIAYFRRLERRTIEGNAVSKTVVIEKTAAPPGALDLDDSKTEKFFDWIGTPRQTFFRVDPELRILGFDATVSQRARALDDTDRATRLFPDFVHSVVGALNGSREFAIVTALGPGNLLISDPRGIIASYRRNSWLAYDANNVTEAVSEALRQNFSDLSATRSTALATGFLRLLLETALRRKGTIVVVDLPENARHYTFQGIVRDSVYGAFFPKKMSAAPVSDLELRSEEFKKLLDLARVDGALIFSPSGVLQQIGAMIIPGVFSEDQSLRGAREVAAFTAARRGALAFRVSTDGEISMFFRTPNYTGDEVHRIDLF